jgi:hypothetical protein
MTSDIHDKFAACHPSLSRGQVWCHSCGHTQKVNSAGALRHGWPRCCGQTMSIDSPEERAALRARGA